ncbi:MAG: hypothetical protein M9939_13620 [Mesorhizobium sp.]|nr:hypothetical protein [Mesorhizobium sp.]MCO5162171.1 hypothetical protein [Mesorhizobium sp.]
MNDNGDPSRKFPARQDADAQDEFSQEAAANRPPENGMGLTPSAEDQAKRHPTPSPAAQKTSGLGPAIAEHSKDAKAPKGGRQPGAYVKD